MSNAYNSIYTGNEIEALLAEADTDAIHVGDTAPEDEDIRLWYDTDEPGTTVVTSINGATGAVNLLDFVYPVGSIYMSVNSVSPATLFGGTWERIQDTFLLAAGSTYTAGSSGGEAEHQLIADELPALNGKLDSVLMDDGRSISFGGIVTGTLARSRSWSGASGNASYTATIAFGNDQPHNNMPPYLTVYIWKRTA